MWRNTGLGLRFLGVDGRMAGSVVVLLYYPTLMSLYFFIGTIAILATLEQFGYSVPNALRKLRAMITGNTRSAIPPGYKWFNNVKKINYLNEWKNIIKRNI